MAFHQSPARGLLARRVGFSEGQLPGLLTLLRHEKSMAPRFCIPFFNVMVGLPGSSHANAADAPIQFLAKNPSGRWVRATETMNAKITIAPSQLATQISRLLPCFSATLPSTT